MSAQAAEASGASGVVAERTYRKVFWRLMPFLMLCYVVAYLDRVNVGFARLQMSQQLGFSETVYGLGAGIFFIGYFFFEVPSNIILHRVGARMWDRADHDHVGLDLGRVRVGEFGGRRSTRCVFC